jgi:hypothetical protein
MIIPDLFVFLKYIEDFLFFFFTKFFFLLLFLEREIERGLFWFYFNNLLWEIINIFFFFA